MIISFGETTPALLAGAKTVTRRHWTDSHARHFKRLMRVDAWNTTPRNVKGNPHKIATIVLTEDPVSESTLMLPGKDWDAEGFAYMVEHGLTVFGEHPSDLWREWRTGKPQHFYVVRFEVVEYLEGPLAQGLVSARTVC